MKARLLNLGQVALLVGGVLTVACGGGAQEGAGPKTPAAVAPPSATTEGGVAATPGGQQFAVSDAPTSEGGAPRPAMNASAQSAYQAGMQAFQAGDLQGAKNQFVSATQADAKAYQAYYSLGVVRERMNETSGALQAYRQATAIVPDYEPAIGAYAVLLARTGKPDEANDFLNARQAQMPKSAAVSAAMAEVKSIQGDSGAAQRLAQEALKKNPDYRPAMITLARDHYRARRLDLALYALRGILDGYGDENPPRDKNNAEARLLRGLIYKEQGNKAAAIPELQKAIELRPDLVEPRVHLANYLLESGNATEAAGLLEGALKYDSLNVLARLNLGDAYRLLGKTVESQRELDWVVKTDPSVAQAHYNLGLLYLFSATVPGMTAGQAADKAIVELETYKKLKPRAAGGAPDDTDELITRAKTQKALAEAKSAEAAAAPAAAAPAAAPAATPPAAPKK
ncbi:MAG: tetratricopeptide repeat protein [Myxococcales bacterium]|nr:MAG: tetratricopeptide repeat protein [Myxococcales bacterium]